MSKLSIKHIVLTALFAFSANLQSTTTAVTPPQKSTLQAFILLADQYEKEWFETFPELGVFWGRTDVSQERFMDHSRHAILAWQKREDDYLAALKQLDEKALKGSTRFVTYQLLKQTLENSIAARICNTRLWDVNPMAGWHTVTTAVAEKQLIGTNAYRTAALKRWNTFPHVVDEELKNLKEGVRQGYTAPKPAVLRVITQVQYILQSKIEDSPYYDFARRDDDPLFKKQVKQLIQTVINPSLQRYVNYLKNDYLPIARTEIGVSALPNGLACYQAKLKETTTLDLSANEIYDYGLQHLVEINQEVHKIGKKMFGMENMSDIFQEAKHRKAYFFSSEKSILDYDFAALNRVKAKLPAWFGVLPKAEGTIKPYPAYQAKTGAGGEYIPPSLDGTRPGIFYINTDNPTQKSRVDQEATLFHELIPGHHFQIALSYEQSDHHSLDKYLWNSGFGEGWALYAERVADEMGVYSDDISRLGMLSNDALRSARLVIDPGIHVKHWTREKAVSYLKQHTTMSDSIIEGEIDRYIMNPGQATSYLLGKRQIETLRQLAETQLKDNFDIRIFHDQVLKNGTVTLPMLAEQIHEWLANVKRRSPLPLAGEG